jgi:hypothetical protein
LTPVDFPEKTVDLQKPPSMTGEECQPLPVFRDGERCISAWRPTWRERFSILFFGRVWLHVWFGNTQPPVLLEGKRSAFEARR